MKQQDRAYKELRTLILSGSLKVGDLHSEAELGKKLDMSRTPIRSALTVLCREGLVESIPQVGFRVRLIPQHELEEVFELRLLLESKIASTLAQKADTVSLEALKENIAASSDAANQNMQEVFLEYSSEFHYILAELAGYHITIDILRNLRDKVRLLGIGSVGSKAQMKKVIREHRAIYKAIVSGDTTLVEKLIGEHLGTTHERLSDYRRSRS